MKKLLSLIIASFLYSTAHATCINLSHKLKLGAADLEAKQIDCENLSFQMYLNGEPIGEPNKVSLNSQWKNDSVEDEYESYKRKTRWSWNSLKNILVYEYFVDTLIKATNERTLHSGTQVYKRTPENQISSDQYQQHRVMNADGTVTVKQTHNSELMEPL